MKEECPARERVEHEYKDEWIDQSYVKERLKELGKISDNELETFRQRFFSDQDSYFEQQIRLIDAQERLRLAMRYFEPAPTEGNQK